MWNSKNEQHCRTWSSSVRTVWKIDFPAKRRQSYTNYPLFLGRNRKRGFKLRRKLPCRRRLLIFLWIISRHYLWEKTLFNVVQFQVWSTKPKYIVERKCYSKRQLQRLIWIRMTGHLLGMVLFRGALCPSLIWIRKLVMAGKMLYCLVELQSLIWMKSQ